MWVQLRNCNGSSGWEGRAGKNDCFYKARGECLSESGEGAEGR